MTKLDEDYMVGLDIGTNSCGWVATDFKNNILKIHGKTAIGSHLFDEGKSAADRRNFRTTRRRLKRRKWRRKFLEEFFDEEMAKVDPGFFLRRKESGLSPLDSRKKFASIVFPSAKEDKEFYQDYKTIYHLRHALMTQDRKFDLREVYLAVGHIMKYRGNFLNGTPVKDFNASKIEINKTLDDLNELYASLVLEHQICFDIKNSSKIEYVIKDKTAFKLDKSKEIAKLLPVYIDDKSEMKLNKDISRQISNAILGYKTKFETILFVEIDREEKNSWEFKLSDVDADDKLNEILPSLNDEQQEILNTIKSLFSAISLLGIVDEGKTLSESMIRKYNDHAKDLALLKKVIANHSDKNKAKKLAMAYNLYVNNRHNRILRAKKLLKKTEFYNVVKKNLDNSVNSKKILEEIALDSFMPKQRTNENGVIPFQLHQIELDKIIANQGKYYPFLKEINPVESHRSQAPYKLDELLRFRVPYYVGPMIETNLETTNDQVKQNQKFAWMVRKESGRITPWNFEEKVDTEKSANKFIKRMTTKDTYLLGEDVLPANSMLYQKFVVLDELNKVRVNKKKLPVEVKQQIFNDLFKNSNTVTIKSLTNWIKQNQNLPYIKVKGIADENKFNANLSTYNKLKRSNLFDKELDDFNYRDDFEKIIEWSTVFEDKLIYKKKLETISWLKEKQIKALLNMRLQGWGRLSNKLLTKLIDSNGQNIIEQLWDGQKTFIQIVNEPSIKEAIIKANQDLMRTNSMEDILSEAYTSPANKKMVRQVVKVAHDIQKAVSGKAPKQIAIEFARNPQKNKELSRKRGSDLQRAYREISNDILNKDIKDQLDQYIKDNKLSKDKYFLYFMQLGRDAYTGKPINIDEIEQYYEIDHILPQSIIKDDSLSNRVLVSKPVNNGKSDNVPLKLFGNNQAIGLGMTVKQMWNMWYEKKVITAEKKKNLFLDPKNLNKYQTSGFIRRQLVETSQVIKLATTILQSEYPNTEIIVVKASSNHYLRKAFNLYKSREVNDYHHAIDAYLTTICGNLLYQTYPNMRPFFVYGQFKKFSSDPELEKKVIDKLNSFNFISQLIENKSSDKLPFNRNTIKKQLQTAYQYKYILVSRDTVTQDQEMFKMSIYPKPSRDSKSRKLIPKGKNLPTDIYGGYTGNSDAFLSIVKINKAKGYEYRVIGIPMRALGILNKVEGTKDYNKVLYKVLEPMILFSDKGKRKSAIKSFEIIRAKVPFKQLVLDGDRKFMLASSTYLHNAKQLVLSVESMRVITEHWLLDKEEDKDKKLIDVYDEILNKIDKYLPLFDINKFRQKLHDGRDKFVKLSINDKKRDINQILNGLHDNAVTGDLKNIGLSTPLGKLQVSSGITLSENAMLIYQSPTGLFEKRVKISNL